MPIGLMDIKGQIADVQDEVEAAVLAVVRNGQFILGPNVKALEAEVDRLPAPRPVPWVSPTAPTGSRSPSRRPASARATRSSPRPSPSTRPPRRSCRRAPGPSSSTSTPRPLNIDPAAIAGAITAMTKAIMPVDLFGLPADADAISAVASEHGLTVVEDACQAFGATLQGAARRQPRRPRRLQLLPHQEPGRLRRRRPRHRAHRRVRRDGPHAALPRQPRQEGLRLHRLQLAPRRDPGGGAAHGPQEDRRLERPARPGRRLVRRRAARRHPPARRAGRAAATSTTSTWRARARRDEVAAALKGAGVACAAYYTTPLHLQPALSFLGHKPGDFPATEEAAATNLALPMHPHLARRASR